VNTVFIKLYIKGLVQPKMNCFNQTDLIPHWLS